MLLVHERHTCHNNPFNILTNDDDDDDTVVASNCSPRQPPPSVPTSDLPVRRPINRPKCHKPFISSPTKQPIHLSTTEGAGQPITYSSHCIHSTSHPNP